MKKIFALSIFCLFMFNNAFAQSKKDDIIKLFEVMQSDKMMDGMMDQMMTMMKSQASTQITGEDAQKKYDEFVEFMMEEVKAMTKKLQEEEMVGIYDKHFTHEEIKDMIKFYESPAGQKLLEKTPEISKDLMTIMLQEYMPAFQQKLKEKLEEMK